MTPGAFYQKKRQTVEDSGANGQELGRNLLPGPADESSQTLAFIATNNNNALFSIQPFIAADGTLPTPAANASGSAIVTIRLRTAGERQTEARYLRAQTFTISVTAVNDLRRSRSPVHLSAMLRTTPSVIDPAATVGDIVRLTSTAEAWLPDFTVNGSVDDRLHPQPGQRTRRHQSAGQSCPMAARRSSTFSGGTGSTASGHVQRQRCRAAVQRSSSRNITFNVSDNPSTA
jgi:hypothetical protein